MSTTNNRSPTQSDRTRAVLVRAVLVSAVLVSLSLIAASCSTTDGIPTVVESPAATTTAPTVSDAHVGAAAARFLAEQSARNGAELVTAISENRHERWVPWLLDLLRINVSNIVSMQIGETLEAITGLPSTFPVPDMIAFGGWAHARELDGGEGYVKFKATLYERIDSAFGDLLRSIEDPVTVAAIQWGGVPLGGIPELNDPARVSASEADWMEPDEIVLGVVANGQAVAYPLRIMARHELANDTVGGDDLAIVYCTLCRSALVFERTVASQTLDFLTSGLLLNSNKIMYDVQTGSLWHHLRGTAIGGELTGTELTVRSVNHMRWSDWVAENPGTEVLALPEPIYFEEPERPAIAYDYTPGEAYRSYYDNPEVWFPILDAPATFAVKTEVVGIDRNGDSVAFDVGAFTALDETTEIVVGGDTLTVVSTGAGVRVFDGDGERVASEQSFWFAWYANHPDTRTLDF